MPQPQWITESGSLGTIPEGVFYSVPVQASASPSPVFYRLISGSLPNGVEVTADGFVKGTPRNVILVQGTLEEVYEDVTSKFAVRAYTTKNGLIDGPVDRINDRTFTITVASQNQPEFITPSGLLATYFDGTEISIQIGYIQYAPATITLYSGSLPPGCRVSSSGLISGIIFPDSLTTAYSRSYQFTLKLSDGTHNVLRTFSIYVYARNTMTADNYLNPDRFRADITFVTADVVPQRAPVLLNPQGSIGVYRADNFFAYKFNAIDFDGDPVEYEISVGPGLGFDLDFIPGPVYQIPGTNIYTNRDPSTDIFNFTPGSFDYNGEGFDQGAFSLPPGLALNQQTGWFYGYIPNQGDSDTVYQFAIRVAKANDPTIISEYYYYSIELIGNIDTDVEWLTPADLGTIDNGAISTLVVEAVNTGGRALQYQLKSGSNSRLPEGLILQPSGHITGRVSFNTFALDGGSTIFDVGINAPLGLPPTTFDLSYVFTVNAFAPATQTTSYAVSSIQITNPGSGYVSTPIVTISAPPSTVGTVRATAGPVTISGGMITAIAVGNGGQGYDSIPTVTISDGGGTGAQAIATIVAVSVSNAISVYRTFTIKVARTYDAPYESLYIKAMPPENDRALISQLIQNQDIIPNDLVYRADDPNFGVAKNVTYVHAYGLTASTYSKYISALYENHYWKNLTLGQVKTARALDDNGNVLYEVVYSEILDDLVNGQGSSVGKSVDLAYPIENDTISTVYPNSLVDMRTQVVDTVGQLSNLSGVLPLWMTSRQINGKVLGFTPAWVIAYTRPGQAGRIQYNIQQQFGDQLNLIDFKVDRYELDRSQTWDWDPATQKWQPQPPIATTFDSNTTVFDGDSTRFITPAVRWEPTDAFDKYLVFPYTNILGR